MKLEESDRLKLRNDLVDAHRRSTGNDLLELSRHAKEEYYNALREDMCKFLKLKEGSTIFSAVTFRNFIFRLDILNFGFSTVDCFKNYVKAVNKWLTEKREASHLRGASLITAEFADDIYARGKILTRKDFYLGKREHNCQWYGVICDWDCERDILDDVCQEIKRCFDWEPKFAAVISGTSGSGKSIFLKKMALSVMNEEFKVLWIDNMYSFCENDFEKIFNSNGKYLLIFDDWPAIEKDISIVTKFINSVLGFDNVRVVIGDQHDHNKEYQKHTLDGNIFKLKSSENERIINKILGDNAAWEKTASDILTPEILNAPLFLIIFVLIRSTENEESGQTRNIVSRFRHIVKKDLDKIKELYPGLVKALFYFAHLTNQYHLVFSWNALLNLAEHFERKNIDRQLLTLDQNIAYKIITHYLSIEYFVIPGFEDTQTVFFHHNLLVSEGICKALPAEFKFNILTFREMAEALISKDEYFVLTDLIRIFNLPGNDVLVRKYKKLSDSILSGNIPFSHLFVLNEYVKNLYRDADSVIEESFWEDKLLFTILFFEIFGHNCVQKIMGEIIKRGCIAPCITTAYHTSLKNKNYLLKELKRKICLGYLQKSKDTQHHVYTLVKMHLDNIPL